MLLHELLACSTMTNAPPIQQNSAAVTTVTAAIPNNQLSVHNIDLVLVCDASPGPGNWVAHALKFLETLTSQHITNKGQPPSKVCNPSALSLLQVGSDLNVWLISVVSSCGFGLGPPWSNYIRPRSFTRRDRPSVSSHCSNTFHGRRSCSGRPENTTWSP